MSITGLSASIVGSILIAGMFMGWLAGRMASMVTFNQASVIVEAVDILAASAVAPAAFIAFVLVVRYL